MERPTHTDPLTELLSSSNFLRLDPAVQKQIIHAVNRDKARPGGFMGQFLGGQSSNRAIHTVLILCLALILIVVMDNLHAYQVGSEVNMDLVGVVIPVISLAIGYIFGRESK